MRVLVTTGTSSFDPLLRKVDEIANRRGVTGWIFTVQTGSSTYTPRNACHFSYTDQIQRYYEDADLIISHAGAGTVFRVLEMGKRLILVPNPAFKDEHQKEICRFVESNNYALVAWTVDELESMIEEAFRVQLVSYEKPEEQITSELFELIWEKIHVRVKSE